MLEKTIEKLNDLLKKVPEDWAKFSEEELNTCPQPNKWCKKEILGHLIDSALNNHQRFVKAQFESQPFKMQRYRQNDWVLTQNYQHEDSASILALWVALNRHIAYVISQIPEEKLNNLLDMGETSFFDEKLQNDKPNLQNLIEDYLLHMEHHLKQIFGN